MDKNGYNETLQLLKFHKNSSDDDLDAFFNFYYHNQWINHEYYEDEMVMDIRRNEDGKIDYVIGNEYDKSGRLIYHGSYRKGKFDGEGTLFNPDQSYDKGKFDDGKRSGVFKTFTDRNIIREAEYNNNQMNGRCIEYYNSIGSDGKPLIKAIYQYKGGKKNGVGEERDGKGGLIFKGMFKDDSKDGEGCEYLSPHLCKKGTFNRGRLQPNWKWCIKKTPKMDKSFFDYYPPKGNGITDQLSIPHYNYSDDYYHSDPIPLQKSDNGTFELFNYPDSDSVSHICMLISNEFLNLINSCER